MNRRLGGLILVVAWYIAAAGTVSARSQVKNRTSPAGAGVGKEFLSEFATVKRATLHYVRGGKGPAIVLIHGFPQDWSEWLPIMPALAEHFTVVAIDLPGIGRSTPASNGYDAANMAQDIYQLVSALKLKQVYVVGHDIGGQVAYAFVRRFPQATRGAMILDTPIPGIEGWEEVQGAPYMWHVHFMQVPGLAEKLVDGRQEAYLGYFFQFGKFTKAETAHYLKAYGTDAQLHAAFEMYRAFPANAQFNAAQRGPMPIPLFFGTGDRSPFATLVPKIAEGLRAHGCTHVETGLIHGAGHYLVEDQPNQVAELIERYASVPH